MTALLLALLQALPAAVIGTDQDGVVQYMNPRARTMGGLLADDGLGLPVTQLLALFQDGMPVDAARQVRDCVAQQEVLEVARGAVLLRHLDGKRIDVQYSCAPLAQGHRLTVSVSLSARQFYQRDIVRNVAAALEAAGVPGHCIELEIAAAILIDRNQNCELILRQFRQLGIAITISDCGTGDASLNYLQRFPTDAVKIEKCFVDDLGKPGGDGAMVRAIVAMAHTLKLRTIAGGVENVEQLELLAEMGCDEAFGYLIGRAMAPDGIETLLKSATLA